MSNSPPSANRIDDAEWDFRIVPDEELLAACYYEFARESNTLVSWLKGSISEKHKPGMRRDVERIRDYAYPLHLILHVVRDFDKPWSRLEESRRKEILLLLARDSRQQRKRPPYYRERGMEYTN